MPAYLDFLNKLIALGSKLPQLLPILLQIVDLLRQAAVVIGWQPKMMAAGDLGSQEIEAEAKVAELCGVAPENFGAIGDGSIIEAIRNVWAFIQSNPLLLQIVQQLLALWLQPRTPPSTNPLTPPA